MIKIGIIGTSGRKLPDSDLLTIAHVEWMVNNVLCYIEDILKISTKNVILVSGGSAWADHVAVLLYHRRIFGGLELYLPTRFDIPNKKYYSTSEGKFLNFLHYQYYKKTGFDALAELATALVNPNVKTVIGKGFFSRNSAIANNSNHLIAFTFNDSDVPGAGGTLDTWKKIKHNNKIHLSLNLV